MPQTNKTRLMQGIRWMAISFPFIFAGPTIFYVAGWKGFQSGNYLWFILSILFMVGAAYFAVRGLRLIISAFFDED